MTRRAVRQAAAGVLAAAALALAAGPVSPAQADGLGDEGGSGAPATNSAPVQWQAKSCHMYGSSSGFGMACAVPHGGTSLIELLKHHPIPDCWDTPVPPGFVPPPGEHDGPGAWWVHTCMHGLDPDNPNPHAVTLSFEFKWIPSGDERTLTSQEQTIVNIFAGDRQIPYPILTTTPTSSPRVGQDVAFSLLNETSTPPLTTGGVTMYARVVHLQVRPEGDSGPRIDCAGPGREMTAQQLDDAAQDDPTVCRYAYKRSSDRAGAGTGGDRYPARVTAFWTIYYNDGSGDRVLGTFRKESINQIRVTEVQTLVVG